MNAHTYYQPTEYEQMLIAAGWITPESVDLDYLEYVRLIGKGDAMRYDEWQTTKRELDELDARWNKEIEPLYAMGGYGDYLIQMNQEQQQLEKQLLREMSWLEVLLGY
ncbi:MAG: hypothetical protein HZC41_24990 [Chloroflexi bacterium]|nr:hypothetical protein [Chloroflexota bacterium]